MDDDGSQGTATRIGEAASYHSSDIGRRSECRSPLSRVPHRLTRCPQFRLQFARRINLRWAILLPRCEVYSRSIEGALKTFRCKHVLDEQGRCAGFALGECRIEEGTQAWYITALQSDLAFAASARLRDLLRGWRCVLFSAILEDALEMGVHRVGLATAEGVARTARWWACRSDEGAPLSWLNIYDRTAADFGMRLEKAVRPVNIQVTPGRAAVLSDEFYVKRFTP